MGAKKFPKTIVELRAPRLVPERVLSAVEDHAAQRGYSLNTGS
jgi:hypothetical protein